MMKNIYFSPETIIDIFISTCNIPNYGPGKFEDECGGDDVDNEWDEKGGVHNL